MARNVAILVQLWYNFIKKFKLEIIGLHFRVTTNYVKALQFRKKSIIFWPSQRSLKYREVRNHRFHLIKFHNKNFRIQFTITVSKLHKFLIIIIYI